MKHTNYFDEFLANTVNLSKFNLETLEERVESIYKALKADPDLGPRIVKKIPQGSWAQKTIISPQNGKPFDADFLLEMREEADWAGDVKKYISTVYKVIHNHSIYGNMPHNKKCRCVYVEYANNAMHVDIVPFVVLADGTQNIVNRDDNCWERTNPGGFTTWMQEKDKITGRNLRKVIRLVKFLRDHKNSFTGTKSILITTLLGERVEEWKKLGDPGYYSDVPTALLHLMSDLDEWLQARPYKPSISDPSGSGVTFDHRWSQETYAYFRDRVHVHAAEIKEAYDETNEESSVAKWQALFGDKFQAPAASSSSSKFGAAGAAGAGAGEVSWSSGRSGRAG
ncbi:hypothetical protein Amsp01_074280 [Amycolatopsis sp. NBRC 101858]|uniref:SMODS domain-containing nucleotidyltransferase n=1 Tax=Amycolatopsis sp. NBRC 101858 TaxID=3032200 RepID=UPI0024A14D1A|nr:hypothetical protein [Amycolatopsis sp. NBRC 101858]GLY41405.1 hypothetical protein Amsp01_074280 [Amycolatopsis sp. NBRC 101858]